MDREWYYPTAFSSWGEEEREAIQRVVASGRHTMGQEVAAFEREFADWHGARHGIMVNSGSSANLIMVAALENLGVVWRGAKVAVPAIAWSTTYAPLVQHGLIPVLVDVGGTWNADWPEDPQIKIDLAVSVPILGSPAEFPKYDIPIIEDCCESLGAVTVSGRRCGTGALMSSFSFFYSHQISAIEGGMILTDSDECARTCRVLRAHGWTRDVRDEIPSFDYEYNFTHFGYNVRPLEMCAAVAREQLRKLPTAISNRQKNLDEFRTATTDLPVTHQEMRGYPSPFGMAFCVGDSARRARVVEFMRKVGIDCRLPTGGSFRMHPYGRACESQVTPRADHIHKTGLFLGNPPWVHYSAGYQAASVLRQVLGTLPSPLVVRPDLEGAA